MVAMQRTNPPSAVGISARAEAWDVESFTEFGKSYTVTKNASPGRPWMCECPAWRFAKRDPGTGRKKDCKHVHAVQLASDPRSTARPTKLPSKMPATEVTVGGERLAVSKRPKPKEV